MIKAMIIGIGDLLSLISSLSLFETSIFGGHFCSDVLHTSDMMHLYVLTCSSRVGIFGIGYFVVSLPCQLCSSISSAGVMFSVTLYLWVVGIDRGPSSSSPVAGSVSFGPNLLKACLLDLSPHFLAKVFASDHLSIHIRLDSSARLDAK
jgi:hypothetical protein